MSEWQPQYIQITNLEKHPNADTLSITKVLGTDVEGSGYPVIVRTQDWKVGDIAAYIPVDTLVPVDREEFKFLAPEAKGKPQYRVKAKKLRGVFSMGLLVPAIRSAHRVPGDSCVEEYQLEKYLPPSEREPNVQLVKGKHKLTRVAHAFETRKFDLAVGALTAFLILQTVYWAWFFKVPPVGQGFVGVLIALLVAGAVYVIDRNRKYNKKPNIQYYDLEGLRKYRGTFQEGELVNITEKVHGCNASYVFTPNGRFWCKSRTQIRTNHQDVWNEVARKYNLEDILKRYPNKVLFGEIYGNKVQKGFTYGMALDSIGFVVFDVQDLVTREFMAVKDLQVWCATEGLPMVPTLYEGPWDEKLVSLAEGSTTLGDKHVREGIVIKPMTEVREVFGLGRKILKLAGEGYLLRKEDD